MQGKKLQCRVLRSSKIIKETFKDLRSIKTRPHSITNSGKSVCGINSSTKLYSKRDKDFFLISFLIFESMKGI